MKTCENCGSEHDGKYASGRFCSLKCAKGFCTKSKRSEINEKVSRTLKEKENSWSSSEEGRRQMSIHWKNYWKSDHREHREKIRQANTGKKRSIENKNLINPKIECRTCKQKGEVLNGKIICETCKQKYYLHYRRAVHFTFNVYEYPEFFDLKLIEEHGWYSPKDNKNGVSRDHLISAKYGFENNIPMEHIKHPANCKLVRHKDNQKKRTKNDITYLELIERINKFKK